MQLTLKWCVTVKGWGKFMICYRARCAIELTVAAMAKSNANLCLLTFTLPGGGVSLSVANFALLWAAFIRKAKNGHTWPVCGVRVWERHRSGGWHGHIVCPTGVNSRLLLGLWRERTGGRCSLEEINQGEESCVAKYLASEIGKFAQKNFEDTGRRVRSWAAWGVGAERSTYVQIASPLTVFFRQWPLPLTKKNRWRLITGLRMAMFRLCLLSGETASRWQQWRAVKRMLRLKPVTIRGSISNMQLTIIGCRFSGQSFQSFQAVGRDKASVITRNRLAVHLVDASGMGFEATMKLPDGAIQEPQPIAEFGAPVSLTVDNFFVNGNRVTVSIVSCMPVKVESPAAKK